MQQRESQRQALFVAGPKRGADQISAPPTEEDAFRHLNPRYRATQLNLQTGSGSRGSRRQIVVTFRWKT
jgi:hypothetical protein